MLLLNWNSVLSSPSATANEKITEGNVGHQLLKKMGEIVWVELDGYKYFVNLWFSHFNS